MKSMSLIGLTIAAALLMGSAIAGERGAKNGTFRGTINVARANGRVSAITLVTPEEYYDVVMDQRGLDLGERMANKKVEITGFVTSRNGRKLLTVQSFMPILTGKVEAASDREGRITVVRIVSREGTFDVLLDEKGMELGREMNGKNVEVVGVIREKTEKGRGIQQEFLVKSFNELKTGEEKE